MQNIPNQRGYEHPEQEGQNNNREKDEEYRHRVYI